MMVNDKGPDLFGKVSDVIAPHGCCSIYTQILMKLTNKK